MSNYLNVIGLYAGALFLSAVAGRLITRWYSRRPHTSAPGKGSQTTH
jgi:hypothetical protein